MKNEIRERIQQRNETVSIATEFKKKYMEKEKRKIKFQRKWKY